MSKVLGENALVKIVNWAKETFVVKGETGGSSGIPSGCICIWSGSTPPEGWALCDGQNGTPDLRGRFVLGYSSTHSISTVGGSETVTLNVNQLPSHTHYELIGVASFSFVKPLVSHNIDGATEGIEFNGGSHLTTRSSGRVKTESTGSGQPHTNMPPYYTLAYIMKL